MNAYSKIKTISKEQQDLLIKLGFLKSTFRRNVSIYEKYLLYREQGEPSTDAIVHTADDFNVSDRHVFRIVAKFSEVKIEN